MIYITQIIDFFIAHQPFFFMLCIRYRHTTNTGYAQLKAQWASSGSGITTQVPEGPSHRILHGWIARLPAITRFHET